MNTEFLKKLGITDQSVIDQIFAENGRDINNAKGEKEALESQVTELQAKVTTLEGDITNRDQQLDDLKKNNKDNEALTQRISQLEAENQANKDQYEQQLHGLRLDNALSRDLKEKYGVKNVKAILPFIKMDDVKYDEEKNALTGLEEQITPLKSGEDTSFLFKTEENPPKPSGTTPNNPNNSGNIPPTGNNGGSGSSLSDGIASYFAQHPINN